MKILGQKDTGRGLLIEYDAGYISAEENKHIIKEAKDRSEEHTSELQSH